MTEDWETVNQFNEKGYFLGRIWEFVPKAFSGKVSGEFNNEMQKGKAVRGHEAKRRWVAWVACCVDCLLKGRKTLLGWGGKSSGRVYRTSILTQDCPGLLYPVGSAWHKQILALWSDDRYGDRRSIKKRIGSKWFSVQRQFEDWQF